MGKPKNKNRKGQNDDFEDNDVDLDPLVNQELDEPTAPQKSSGKQKKKKKKDDWEDDVATEIEALSIEENKGVNSDIVNEDDPVPQKIKTKKKKHKQKSDSEEEEENTEEMITEKKGKTKSKPMAMYDMLMMDDDSENDIPSDNEEETPVIETKKEVIVKELSKKKKDKKKKKDQAEEDIDALLADIDKPKESKKKKKKNKGEETEEGDEHNAEQEQMEAELESKMAAVKVVTMDDLDDEEDDKKKKRKKKKEKATKEVKEEGEKEDEGENVEAKGEEEEGEESTVKTAAQKRKEKRDREKQKKLLEKKKSKGGNKDQQAEGATEEPVAEEDKEVEEKEGEEGDEVKPGKKKKKKGEEEKKKKKAPIAAIKAQLQALKEEEERLRREEEERIQREDEKIKQIEEEKKKEQEKKDKKKQKEKERKDRLRQEGKLLTDKQKQDKRRAQEMLESMKARGFEIPSKDDVPKKRPIYDNKRKKKQQQKVSDQDEERTPSPLEESAKEPSVEPVTPVEETSEPVAETSPEEVHDDWEKVDVKDDWAASDEEVEKEPPVTIETEKSKPEKVEEEVKSKEEEEESEEEESEEEASSEEEESETESEEESSDEDDDLTPVERARERIMKRKEEAEKNRSTDVLRAPVICVLGHVDTGKTKILDKLRRTHVQDGEAGGITQQIGATNVPLSAIKEQTKMCKEFQKLELKLPGMLIIDTPGHESFSNLRSRGSSLCDMAILVVDIMHGLEPQTIESINLLKQRKTPFVIALNKIDRLYQWKPMPQTDVSNVIKKQTSQCKSEYDQRSRQVITEMAEQGLNTAMFYENKNPKEYISLIPTSAHSGDGMGNLIALICELCQTLLAKRLAFSEELQATAMEVKALHGLGTTVDLILVNGKLREGDTVIVPGSDGPIVTQIRGLLMPQPMKELRVKSQWEHHKEVKAAQGVKIIAKDLDKALAGLPVYSAEREDEIEYYKEELSIALKEVLGAIKLSERGVFVQASTLGSMEALLEFLKTSKIPYAGINIGPVHKKDIMRASVMLEHDSQYAVILAFDVKIEKEAQELAESLGVTIFTADIIYHLFDKFTAYRDELKKKKQEEFKHIAVFPCKLRVIPSCIFNSRDPIVCGVAVESGFVKVGTPICVPTKEFLDLGHISSLEVNNKSVEVARKGMEVCIKIESISGDSPKMFGRHFDHTDLLYSKISRPSIDAVKDYFREEMQKSDWQLMVELKHLFKIL